MHNEIKYVGSLVNYKITGNLVESAQFRAHTLD